MGLALQTTYAYNTRWAGRHAHLCYRCLRRCASRFLRVGARRVLASLPPSSGPSVGALRSVWRTQIWSGLGALTGGYLGYMRFSRPLRTQVSMRGMAALGPGHPQNPSGPNKHAGAPLPEIGEVLSLLLQEQDFLLESRELLLLFQQRRELLLPCQHVDLLTCYRQRSIHCGLLRGLP